MIQKSAAYYAVTFAVVCLCLAVGGGCRPTEVDLDHEAVGKWKTQDGLTIAFYKDGVASVEGSKVEWKPIDESSVRFGDEKKIAEFIISKKDDGSTLGVIEFAGTEMNYVFGRNVTYTKVTKKGS